MNLLWSPDLNHMIHNPRSIVPIWIIICNNNLNQNILEPALKSRSESSDSFRIMWSNWSTLKQWIVLRCSGLIRSFEKLFHPSQYMLFKFITCHVEIRKWNALLICFCQWIAWTEWSKCLNQSERFQCKWFTQLIQFVCSSAFWVYSHVYTTLSALLLA